MKNDNVKNGFLDGAMYYSPQTSLFITVLCSSIGQEETFYNEKLLQGGKSRSELV
jgi:hypothetical protein